MEDGIDIIAISNRVGYAKPTITASLYGQVTRCMQKDMAHWSDQSGLLWLEIARVPAYQDQLRGSVVVPFRRLAMRASKPINKRVSDSHLASQLSLPCPGPLLPVFGKRGTTAVAVDGTK